MPKGQPFSVRLDEETEKVVRAEAQRTRRSKSAIVEAFTEETARTRRFPGIAFRGDDARRRAWVIGSGLDVWEIIQMLEDFGSEDALVADTHLSSAQVRIAVVYRDAYPGEVDRMVAENRRPLADIGDLYPFIQTVEQLRLLLDAHLSPARIASPLTERGHDVLSLAAEPTLSGLDDPDVLELACVQDRILVTRNARDFAPLLRIWAEGDRHHAGCILIWSLRHDEFGAIIDGVSELIAARPDAEQWRDLAVAL